jgi:SAM-dependent methyltransferase
VSVAARTYTAAELDQARRSRRHPRPSQFDYIHVRRLVDDLRQALAPLQGRVHDVLDVFCGSRPYDDLLPTASRHVAFDVVDNPYGVADVVSDEFLPFDAASFDLVTCIEAFHYVEDPAHGVAEIRRVLRPGGSVVITVPFAWEYDRRLLEHRYTAPELEHLFAGWEDVRVTENGGRAIVWATLTGTMLERVRLRLPRVARPLFVPVYLALNGLGALLDRTERRQSTGMVTLPMNLLLTARRPHDD